MHADYVVTTTEEILTTTVTEEITTQPIKPTVTTTTEAPLVIVHLVESDTTEADKRPSAVALGVLGIILVIVEIVFFVLMDLSTFKDNFVMMAHNLGITERKNRRRLTGERVNGQVIFQRIGSNTNGIPDDVSICYANRAADPTASKYKSLPYIDQDVPHVL